MPNNLVFFKTNNSKTYKRQTCVVLVFNMNFEGDSSAIVENGVSVECPQVAVVMSDDDVTITSRIPSGPDGSKKRKGQTKLTSIITSEKKSKVTPT